MREARKASNTKLSQTFVNIEGYAPLVFQMNPITASLTFDPQLEETYDSTLTCLLTTLFFIESSLAQFCVWIDSSH